MAHAMSGGHAGPSTELPRVSPASQTVGATQETVGRPDPSVIAAGADHEEPFHDTSLPPASTATQEI